MHCLLWGNAKYGIRQQQTYRLHLRQKTLPYWLATVSMHYGDVSTERAFLAISKAEYVKNCVFTSEREGHLFATLKKLSVRSNFLMYLAPSVILKDLFRNVAQINRSLLCPDENSWGFLLSRSSLFETLVAQRWYCNLLQYTNNERPCIKWQIEWMPSNGKFNLSPHKHALFV